jgi:hypothetical protein
MTTYYYYYYIMLIRHHNYPLLLYILLSAPLRSKGADYVLLRFIIGTLA